MIRGVGETIKTKVREEKSGFFGMLLDTRAYSILGHAVGNKFSGVIRAGEETIRAGQNFQCQLIL